MILKGIPASPGIALGELYVYSPFTVEASERFIEKNTVNSEREKYAAVKKKAEEEIRAIHSFLLKEHPEKAKIFSAQNDILNDPEVDKEITGYIETELWSGDWAVWKVYTKFIYMIQKTKDPIIRERSDDFKDVRRRILGIWHDLPHDNLSTLKTPVIIAARDLLPSDTATLDRRNALAIITETGGSTSHSAIIARSYGIPAVLGIHDLLETVKNIRYAAVDALAGEVFTEPDTEITARLEAKKERYLKDTADINVYLKKEPITADGLRLDTGLNISKAGEEELAGAAYTDFVGLFRTEFMFMERNELPGEEEQFKIYSKVFKAYGQKPVTLRTLDIGGDKHLSYLKLPKEDNPLLGRRAIRLCFDYPDIFKTQIRAALRASVFGNLWLMLPMVSSMDEIRRAKKTVDQVKQDLDVNGIAYNKNFKFGIMIEVPSIALIADLAAREVDFASIGANDLCQYLNAADRTNPAVSDYYRIFHPAMFRLIGSVTEAFTSAGKPLSVCGEIAGDPHAAAVLVGLGLRKLSMGMASLAPVKRMLSRLSIAEAEEIARTVKGLSTAAEVEAFLKQKFD